MVTKPSADKDSIVKKSAKVANPPNVPPKPTRSPRKHTITGSDRGSNEKKKKNAKAASNVVERPIAALVAAQTGRKRRSGTDPKPGKGKGSIVNSDVHSDQAEPRSGKGNSPTRILQRASQLLTAPMKKSSKKKTVRAHESNKGKQSKEKVSPVMGPGQRKSKEAIDGRSGDKVEETTAQGPCGHKEVAGLQMPSPPSTGTAQPPPPPPLPVQHQSKMLKKFHSRPLDGEKAKKLAERMQVVKAKKQSPKPVFQRGDIVKPLTNAVFKSDSLLKTAIGHEEDSFSLLTELTAIESDLDHMPPKDHEAPFLNNENDGKLFVNMLPFWINPRKPCEADLVGVEQDIECNAETITQCSDGVIVLKQKPNIPIRLDVFEEFEYLERRDKSFFSKEVVFGNTVRSMTALWDDRTTLVPPKAIHETGIVFKEPEEYFEYKRSKPFIAPFIRKFVPAPTKEVTIDASQRKKKNSPK